MAPKSVYQLVSLPGDGIGVEVVAEARALLEVVAPATGVQFAIDEIPCGGKYFLDHGRDWPEGADERCRAADAILLGAVGWPGPDGKPVTMPNGQDGRLVAGDRQPDEARSLREHPAGALPARHEARDLGRVLDGVEARDTSTW